MNDRSRRTETDERVKENKTPPSAPAIDPEHDDRSPLDVAFPEPKIERNDDDKSAIRGG